MKKKAIILGLGWVICGSMLAQTRERVVQPAANSGEAKIVSINPGAANVDYDTKLYASKEEAMLAEQTSNPEKPTTADSDPRLEAEGIFKSEDVPVPSRPTTPDTDPKLLNGVDPTSGAEKAPDVNTPTPYSAGDDMDANTGLAKVKTEGAIFNYRKINGPQSQEIPAPQGKIINYRELKGPDDQPREKQPAR